MPTIAASLDLPLNEAIVDIQNYTKEELETLRVCIDIRIGAINDEQNRLDKIAESALMLRRLSLGQALEDGTTYNVVIAAFKSANTNRLPSSAVIQFIENSRGITRASAIKVAYKEAAKIGILKNNGIWTLPQKEV